MNKRGFWELDAFSDVEIERSLKDLLGAGARTEARVVAHLAELEARRLHLKAAAESLFSYCQRRLGFSESEAFYRITAARAARAYPIIFELLERRDLHLTAVALLGKYLTPENHEEMLAQARGKTKRELLEMLAKHSPRPDVPSRIRRLPGVRRLAGRGRIPSGAVTSGPTGVLEPRSPERYRLQLNVSARLNEKLSLARDLTSHANPSGDLAIVIEQALDALIELQQKRRFGQTSKPRREACRQTASGEALTENKDEALRKTPTGAKTGACVRRHIPNETRRRLIARDGLRCTYVSEDGHRCCASAFLQIDHVHPLAKGGSDDVDNLRILCAPHNQLLAEQAFGRAHVLAAQIQSRRLKAR
jgi:5-methylcytosine-specific restriction endonuclease McrA